MSSRRLWSVALAGMLASCSTGSPDIVTPLPGDRADEPAGNARNIVGFVSLGRPVVDATVTAFAHGNLTVGAELGSGLTNESGLFALTLHEDYRGRLLLRTSGGRYSEVAGGFERQIQPGEALLLTTNYDPAERHEGRVISAVSTLSATLAFALGAKYQTPDDATGLADALLRTHLAGALPVDVESTLPIDPAWTPGRWPHAPTAFGLFHAGLSEMAWAMTQKQGVAVSTASLVAALGRDLGDAVFDGLSGQGDDVSVGGVHALGVDTVRWDLAFFTDRYLTDRAANLAVDDDVSLPKLSYELLASDDGFLALVSSNASSLFPEHAIPRRYDRDPPEVEWTGATPLDGTLLNHDFEVAVRVSDVSVATVNFSSADGGTALEYDVALDHWTGVVALGNWGDGPRLVSVTSRDDSGNESVTTRTFVIDRTPPTLVLGPMSPGPTLRVTGTASDVNGIAQVSAQAGVSVVSSDGDPSGSALEFELVLDVEDDSWSVGVTATDRAGNLATAWNSVLIDSTAPVISSPWPAADAWVSPGKQTASVSVKDAVGILAVSLVVDGSVSPTVIGESYVASWSAPSTGTVDITWRAEDFVGNIETLVLTLQIDPTPPKLGDITVVDAFEPYGIFYVPNGLVEVQVEAADSPSGVAAVTIADEIATLKEGLWSAKIAVSGSVLVNIEAADLAGNTSSATIKIVGDSDPPSCSVHPIGNGGAINSLTPTISGTWSDGEGSGHPVINITVGGGLAIEATALPNGTWTATLPPQSEGTAGLAISCTDAIGNTADAIAKTITIDVTPPVLELKPHKVVNDSLVEVSVSESSVSVIQPPSAGVEQAGSCVAVSGEWQCSIPFTRFFHRIEWSADIAIADRWPGFRVEATHEQAYRFPPAEQWNSLVADDDEVFVGFSHPDTWTTTPDAVEVRQTDEAGNTSITRINFEFRVLSPPLFRQGDSETALSWDFDEFELGSGGAADMGRPFSSDPPGYVATAGGVRVTSHTLKNVYEFDVDVTIDAGGLRVKRSFQRTFLEAASLPSECPVGMCKHSWLETDICLPRGGEPSGPYADETWIPSSVHVTQAGSVVSPDDAGRYRVSAGTTIRVDVVAEIVDTCQVAEATKFTFTQKGQTTSRWLNRPSSTCDDTSIPWDISFCEAETGGITYAAPLAITQIQLVGEQTDPPNGSSLTLEYFPAGYYHHPNVEVVIEPLALTSTLSGALPTLTE